MALVIGYGIIIALVPSDHVLVLSVAVPPAVAGCYFIRSIRNTKEWSDIVSHGTTFTLLIVLSLFLAISFARRDDDTSFMLPLAMISYPICSLIYMPWFDRLLALGIRKFRNEN
jgi:hypothetical protein